MTIFHIYMDYVTFSVLTCSCRLHPVLFYVTVSSKLHILFISYDLHLLLPYIVVGLHNHYNFIYLGNTLEELITYAITVQAPWNKYFIPAPGDLKPRMFPLDYGDSATKAWWMGGKEPSCLFETWTLERAGEPASFGMAGVRRHHYDMAHFPPDVAKMVSNPKYNHPAFLHPVMFTPSTVSLARSQTLLRLLASRQ